MAIGRAHREDETRLLERVAQYREEYRTKREAAVREERERRHAGGEVYIAGSWVPVEHARAVHAGLQKRQLVACAEICVLLVLLVGAALGGWKLFTFLFMP